MGIFNTRPQGDDPFWEDNSVSNAMACASKKLVPSWCKEEHHWTAKVLDYFWTDCACCLFYRGIFVGAALSAVFATIVSFLIS